MLGYGDPAGYAPLRESIAAYLATARGVRCSAAQVVVLTSSQQALDLAARLLVDPGDGAWLEDPGYPGARAALLAAGARVVPVPVDGDGLDVADGVRRAGRARLAYVTPSHQYPTGATLSLERRLALLAWARRTGAWIVEDDYDSEFRYDGRPLAAIQGLEPGSRVVYVGTFTKVLFPSLRLAYVVLPAELVVPFVTARTLLDGHTATLPQAVLADFIAEGHFAAHLRRMRTLYRERRDVMVDAVRGRLDGALRLGPSDAGLHVTGHLDARADDRSAARRAARHGVETPPLSSFFLSARRSPGLVLGYAGLSPEAIRAGVRALAAALDPGGRGRPCRASSRAPATSPASAPGPRGR
jgi:GntR family transcriptional regulator/MocR family aminotransferase